jgi:hypothetical protein
MSLYRWLVHTLYTIYAEIHDRLTIDRDQTLPPDSLSALRRPTHRAAVSTGEGDGVLKGGGFKKRLKLVWTEPAQTGEYYG